MYFCRFGHISWGIWESTIFLVSVYIGTAQKSLLTGETVLSKVCPLTQQWVKQCPVISGFKHNSVWDSACKVCPLVIQWNPFTAKVYKECRELAWFANKMDSPDYGWTLVWNIGLTAEPNSRDSQSKFT